MNIFSRISKKEIKKTPLSEDTIGIIKVLFEHNKRPAVEKLLIDECGNNLVGFEELDAEGLERIRFAVLKISNGNIDSLISAIDFSKQDWRDVLIDAGFADDIHAHKQWKLKISRGHSARIKGVTH